RAGLYSTMEADPGPRPAEGKVQALSISHFRSVLAGLIQIGVEFPVGPQRTHYLTRRDELLTNARTGRLTVAERGNLSEYLIRLRQYAQAVEILTPAAAEDRRNFMVLANLATAHQLAGRLDRAMSYLELEKDVWPQEWPGLSKEQLGWAQEVEKYHLRLVRLR